jgi:hypothetical protein
MDACTDIAAALTKRCAAEEAFADGDLGDSSTDAAAIFRGRREERDQCTGRHQSASSKPSYRHLSFVFYAACSVSVFVRKPLHELGTLSTFISSTKTSISLET